MRPQWQPKVDSDEFTRKHNEGLTAPQLADYFGIAQSTVFKWRKKLGLKGASPVKMTADRKARIEAMLDQRIPFKEIARIEGITPQTLTVHFPNRGWTKQEVGRYAAMNIRLEQIAA